jgi:AraC family transcriptional regulator
MTIVFDRRLSAYDPRDRRMPETTHINEIVFDGDVVKIGRWRLPAQHPHFRDSGPTRHYLVVFPRTSAWIQHAGERAFVADPTVVTLYNRGQEYTRGAIAGSGDWCDYYAIEPAVLRDIVSPYDRAAADATSRVMRFARTRASAEVYFTQRAIYRYVRRNATPDPLAVEETMIAVVSQVLRSAYDRQAAVRRPQIDLVERAREVVARRFAARFTLTELAATLGTSVFHLCRLFRGVTGTTIHAYRNEVRLRAALARVLDTRTDFSTIALDLGYATHSHFTAAFRECYGITPSAARRGEYVPSKATAHVFPASDDCSQNWRTLPPSRRDQVTRSSTRAPFAPIDSPRSTIRPSS